MNGLFGEGDVRLHNLRDLPVKLRHCLAARFFKCCQNFRVDLLQNRFGPALHFFTTGVKNFLDLLLESGQRLLLHVGKLSGMLFELLAGLPGTRQGRLQPFGLLLDGIPQRGYPLLCLCCRTRRRYCS